MKLRDLAAAFKARYRPVFRGGVEKEVRKFAALSERAKADAALLAGPGRAIASLTEGRGE